MTENLNAWSFADIGLRDRLTGAVTTFRVSTRQSTDGRYFPVLKSFSGLGMAMNGELPAESSGSVVLDNTRGSFGYQRRFVDLFERYTPIEASIDVYCNFTSPTDFEPDGGRVTVFKGTIKSATASGDDLTLSVNARQLPKRIVTKAIDPVAFPSAPTSAFGRHLPIVFGSAVEVGPVLVSAAGSTSPTLAIATTLGNTHAILGVTEFLARDKSGTFRRVFENTTVDTAVYGYAAAANAAGYTLQTTAEAIREIDLSGLDPYLLTGGYIGIYQPSGGTINSELTIRLYTASTNQGSQREQIEEFKITHTTTGVGYGPVYFTLREPHVMDTSKRYWIGVHRTTGGLNWATNTGNPSVAMRERLISEGDAAPWRLAFLSTASNFVLFAAKITPSYSSAPDENGLGYASFAVTQTALTGTQIDLSKIQWVCNVSGLIDDGSGNITGSAGSLIINPFYAVSLLCRRWSGAAWVAGELDTALYSTTHGAIQGGSHQLSRTIKGRTEGRTTWIELVGSILRSAAARVVMNSAAAAGKFFGIYGWGYNQTSVYQFSDENSRVTDIEFSGTETIVNALQFYYDRKISTADIAKITAEGSFAEFAGALNWYSGANAIATALASESKAVFGTRFNGTARMDWIPNTTSAEILARYMLGTFGRPFTFVTVEAPLRAIKDLQLLQVVDILDPEFPAYFGSSASADGLHYAATPIEISEGSYLKRAVSVRAQIEAREVSASDRGIPMMRLRCRVLDNYPKDPT
jgi:hypothetical protein